MPDPAVLANPSNVDQLGAWDRDRGAFWAERADRFDEGLTGAAVLRD